MRAIREDILVAFARNDDFAYPARRVYRLKSEGKTVRDPDDPSPAATPADRDEDGVA